VWDTTKPNGQPRRKLATDRARAAFGFESHTPFEAGLKKTIDWFESHRLELTPAAGPAAAHSGSVAP
jgi:nucleoside-diphosphate-sugar epimerase